MRAAAQTDKHLIHRSMAPTDVSRGATLSQPGGAEATTAQRRTDLFDKWQSGERLEDQDPGDDEGQLWVNDG